MSGTPFLKKSGSSVLVMVATLLVPASDLHAAPYGECRAGYWSSNRNLDDSGGVTKGTCFINWRESLSDSLRVAVNGRLGWNDSGADEEGQGRLREGFLQGESGPWSMRLGRQIIAWGRADRINPTDSLSPRDFTLLVAEDEEERMGIDALLGRYQSSSGPALTAVVAPRFEPHKIPQGLMPPGLIPAAEPEQVEWAIKVDNVGDNFDWSLSYFDGFNRFPRYWGETTLAGVRIHGNHEQARTFGGDFATTAGDWAIRGEAAISDLQPQCAPCTLNERRLYRVVIGGDRDFAESANINIQLFTGRRDDYHGIDEMAPPLQPLQGALNRLNLEFSERDLGATLRLSNHYLNDRLRLEFRAIFDLENSSRLLRPRLSYALSDSVKLVAGGDAYIGRQQSLFGTQKENRLVFGEVAFIF